MAGKDLLREYRLIPARMAKHLAEQYQKDIVVIFSYDAAHHLSHTANYGNPQYPQFRDIATEWGHICSTAIGADRLNDEWFKEFRTSDEAIARAQVEHLRDALLKAADELSQYNPSLAKSLFALYKSTTR